MSFISGPSRISCLRREKLSNISIRKKKKEEQEQEQEKKEEVGEEIGL